MPHTRPQVHSIRDGRAVAFPGWIDVPGLLHGTTTRAALPGGGKRDLFETITRLRDAGVLPRRFTLGGDQVHGNNVAVVHEPLEPRNHPAGFRWDEEAQIGEFAATDALVCSIPGVLLAIQTADCLPLFLVDRPIHMVGVAHCGWKGTLAGIATRTAGEMIALGARASRLEAWIGPCIRAPHYEVGPDLIACFRERFPDAPVSEDGVHLDLAAIVRWQLCEAGMLDEHIFDSRECTRSDLATYYSYRGEGPETGRLVSFIGFSPETQ